MTLNKIALLNDQLRLTMATSSRGRVVMTSGVAALPEEDVARVLDRVRRFAVLTNGPRTTTRTANTTSAASSLAQ
jgi:hypothetical protein